MLEQNFDMEVGSKTHSSNSTRNYLECKLIHMGRAADKEYVQWMFTGKEKLKCSLSKKTGKFLQLIFKKCIANYPNDI